MSIPEARELVQALQEAITATEKPVVLPESLNAYGIAVIGSQGAYMTNR